MHVQKRICLESSSATCVSISLGLRYRIDYRASERNAGSEPTRDRT